MNLHFTPEAKDELDEAIRYYEQQRRGLGDEFALEVADAIEKIVQSPGAWQALEEGEKEAVRRCRTRRFPYGVVYRVRGHEIEVVAVMHLKRRPGYWRGRI